LVQNKTVSFTEEKLHFNTDLTGDNGLDPLKYGFKVAIGNSEKPIDPTFGSIVVTYINSTTNI
jgi:hypothetical protein